MNRTLSKVIIVIILGAVNLCTCISFGLQNNELRNKIMLLDIDTRMLKKKIETIHKEIDETIIENNLANNIIVSNTKEDFLMLLRVIAQDYYFSVCNIEVSDSENIVFKKQKFFDIAFNRINFYITADSEAKVYAFIDEVIDKIPGYATIKSLHILEVSANTTALIELNTYTLKMH